jgi:carbamoyl-phosphate synthase large subunit
MRNKRVFISGGAGVIGTALVKKLNEMGAVIYVGDLKPRPKDWPATINYRQGDLNYISKDELNAFAPEFFYHLAATFERSTETYDFWDENYQHNINLSHYLMSCLKESNSLEKVIFASSYLIYNPDMYNFNEPAEKAVRLKETDPINPRNLTGAAKLLHEIELNFLGDFKKVRFETVCARIFRSYGKNSRDVISRWIRDLLRGEQLNVFKKEGIFDYIYADEVAEGLIKLASSKVTGVINLGNDNARRVEEIIDVLRDHFPDMKVANVDANIPYEASQANMDLFKQGVGWVPKMQLEDTIPEMIDFERTIGSQGPSNAEINILVTSISKKVPLLKSLRTANLKLGNTGKIIGADIDGNCIGKYFTDIFWKMPELEKIEINDFIGYCRDNKISCVIPTRDGELSFFSRHKETLLKNGIKVMISEHDAIQTCLDKLMFFKKADSMGFPVIKTVGNIDELTCEFFVVKERYGAGSDNIGLNLTKEQAVAKAADLEVPIFQPYIYGRELSIDLYVDTSNRTKGAVARNRVLVVNGESQITTTLRNQKLEQLCSDLSEKLDLYGHIVLQAIIDEEENIRIIECNSRFGGASSLSLKVGLDSFYWFLLEASDEDISTYPFIRSINEKKQVRYMEDLII